MKGICTGTDQELPAAAWRSEIATADDAGLASARSGQKVLASSLTGIGLWGGCDAEDDLR